ncbi:gp77 [Sphingomonas phage PAU]|uniref:gp77 n=1 Tax=Sphingomonas phage PAU TaxID=1150991 RepID=UPI00025731D7|nr:gp77 [Sphingomonas phage PAU]AFF28075.1 gp77 [Sphingomonas phage PAU]
MLMNCIKSFKSLTDNDKLECKLQFCKEGLMLSICKNESRYSFSTGIYVIEYNSEDFRKRLSNVSKDLDNHYDYVKFSETIDTFYINKHTIRISVNHLSEVHHFYMSLIELRDLVFEYNNPVKD